MLPLNDLQKKVFEKLNGNLGIKVYDDVPKNTKLPVCVLDEIKFTDGFVKGVSYEITQKFNIYTEYEGKKEVNDLVSKLLFLLSELDNTMINENYYLTDTKLADESLIYRGEEGFYLAYINIKFEIEKAI